MLGTGRFRDESKVHREFSELVPVEYYSPYATLFTYLCLYCMYVYVKKKSIIPDMYEVLVVSELIFWVPDECDVGSTPCYAPNLGPQGLHELLLLKGPRSEFPRLKISII